MEIKLPRPSELIVCKNLASCFQAFYNLLFAILILLAFVYFIYGALQYLLSGAKVYSKEEGKKKMINSVIAVILALSIPIILNMINPGIFKVELKLPVVESTPFLYHYYGDVDLEPNKGCPGSGVKYVDNGPILVSLSSIGLSGKLRPSAGVCANIQIVPYLCVLDKLLDLPGQNDDPKSDSYISHVAITSGYSQAHQNDCHKTYGFCLDMAVRPIATNPDDEKALRESCPKYLKLQQLIDNASHNIFTITQAARKELRKAGAGAGVPNLPSGEPTFIFETKRIVGQAKNIDQNTLKKGCAPAVFTTHCTVKYVQRLYTREGKPGEIRTIPVASDIYWNTCLLTTGDHLHVFLPPIPLGLLDSLPDIVIERDEDDKITSIRCKQ
jgi:hypothetical protein